MPRVPVTSVSSIERKYYDFFRIDPTSEESSTEEEILPPKKRKLKDSELILHQLPGDKQKSLETEINEKHFNKAYVESVEAARHSLVESSQKLSFEYQECIESEINNMETSAPNLQTEEANRSKSVDSYLRYLKVCRADKTGYAGNLLKIQTSCRKEFKDSEKRLKEEAKAIQNDMKIQYMALQEEIKNAIKEEQIKSIYETLRNVYKM